MLPTMEQADGWVRLSKTVSPDEARCALWRRTVSLVNAAGVGRTPQDQAAYAKDWFRAACRLLKSQGKRIILTDYPAQDVPWHVLGMQLTLAACVGEVGPACGELLKWCDKNNVPLCEAMEGL